MQFEGFKSHFIDVSGARIHCRVGGDGPPLLLLHGCPQSHFMWHKLAPALSLRFTVIASDLRGYGDSSKPQGLPDHANYSFRAMAGDQVELMAKLGFSSFSAVGHDRGARVLHRMALDSPTALHKAALLDILPTKVLYENTDKQFASAYWEWFFFIQGGGLPEKLLSADPEAFLRYEIGHLVDSGVIGGAAWAEYLRVLQGEAAMHGMCEDYRAGASIDLEHDTVDKGRLAEVPMLLLWGELNPIWQKFDMLEVWRQHVTSVTGRGIRSGHYLAEEAPNQVLDALLPFLTSESN